MGLLKDKRVIGALLALGAAVAAYFHVDIASLLVSSPTP